MEVMGTMGVMRVKDKYLAAIKQLGIWIFHFSLFVLYSSLFTLHSSLKKLSFLVLVYSVINSQRRAQHFDEALCLFGSPAVLHLAILSELGLEQVVG